MPSCFAYFGAFVEKHWTAATSTAAPMVFTKTPLPELSQRSLVELSIVPMILATAAGSLFRDISGKHSIVAVGTFKCNGLDYFRAYLSKDAGSFIQIVADPKKPDEVMECRVYQNDNTIKPQWTHRDEQIAALGTDQIDEAQNVDFWLLDNPDPNVGGMIGCPVMAGKNVYDADGNLAYTAPLYNRSWVYNNSRIDPYVVVENIVDMNGHTETFTHYMMPYERQLPDGPAEYLLVAVVETDDTMDVNMWLGLDIKTSDMTIYAVNAS